MFYQEKGNVVGVLCDWNLASDSSDTSQASEKRSPIVKPKDSKAAETGRGQVTSQHAASEQGVESDRPRYRTGTGPFMAYELLLPNDVPQHIYRFDLESFFWLLAWFCAVFDPKKHSIKRQSPWDHPELLMVSEKKGTFLQSSSFYGAFKYTDSGYQHLVDSWVAKLHLYILENVMRDITELNTLRVKVASPLVSEDLKEKARQALKDLEEKRRDVITYEGFMGCIGATP